MAERPGDDLVVGGGGGGGTGPRSSSGDAAEGAWAARASPASRPVDPTIMVFVQGPLSLRRGMPVPLDELNLLNEVLNVERVLASTGVRLEAVGGPWEGLSAMRRPGVRVIEISCHGTEDGRNLIVEDRHGAGLLVPASTLRSLFSDNPDTRLVVLSACYSGNIAREAFAGASRSGLRAYPRARARPTAAFRALPATRSRALSPLVDSPPPLARAAGDARSVIAIDERSPVRDVRAGSTFDAPSPVPPQPGCSSPARG